MKVARYPTPAQLRAAVHAFLSRNPNSTVVEIARTLQARDADVRDLLKADPHVRANRTTSRHPTARVYQLVVADHDGSSHSGGRAA